MRVITHCSVCKEVLVTPSWRLLLTNNNTKVPDWLPAVPSHAWGRVQQLSEVSEWESGTVYTFLSRLASPLFQKKAAVGERSEEAVGFSWDARVGNDVNPTRYGRKCWFQSNTTWCCSYSCVAVSDTHSGGFADELQIVFEPHVNVRKSTVGSELPHPCPHPVSPSPPPPSPISSSPRIWAWSCTRFLPVSHHWCLFRSQALGFCRAPGDKGTE